MGLRNSETVEATDRLHRPANIPTSQIKLLHSTGGLCLTPTECKTPVRPGEMYSFISDAWCSNAVNVDQISSFLCYTAGSSVLAKIQNLRFGNMRLLSVYGVKLNGKS